MRIVAGKFRGARIEAPKGLATRPTSDRVRQALFNVLEHGAPAFRFRRRARARPVCRLWRARARSLLARRPLLPVRRGQRRSARGHPPQCRGAASHRHDQDLAARRDEAWACRHDAELRPRLPRSALRQGTWGKGASIRREGGWIREGAVAVLEERADAEIALPPGFEEIDTRVYGDTKLIVMRAFPPPASARAGWLRRGGCA